MLRTVELQHTAELVKRSKMDFCEHEFANVEAYLHHRPPYLKIEQIVSIAATEMEAETTLTGDEF